MSFTNFSKCRLVAMAFSLCLVVPSLSFAVSVNIDSVTGAWVNPIGGTTVTGVDSNQIRWGNPATANGKSGFDFDGIAPATQTINPATTPFILGTFTHINNPIYGGGPSTVALAITVNFGNVVPPVVISPFKFSFLETPNYGNPCAAGGVPPCPDKVTFLNNGISTSNVTINGVDFNLQILGFQTGGSLVNDFITLESQATSADLVAQFVAVPPTQTPEPGTVILFGTGLAGLAAWRYRKSVHV